ncbi:regucalcin-like isoform X2 [Ceratina calcarata]|uniref:Regucalcin n=1 Tax=Ceratina calcarata TaxID=156304 RepID=A0AAJ7N3N7_9HYME|nr:regucalcin-like isoform X2 [Ceratina calcarata]
MRNIIYNILLVGLCLAFVHGLEIKPIVGRFEHSEEPHWDHQSQKLYFVDIEAQKICRFGPATKQLACVYIPNGPVGMVIPVAGEPGTLVFGTRTDLAKISWDGTSNITRADPEILTVVDRDRNGTRWNDGKADSSGRLWAGTIGPEVNEVVVPNQASFYRIGSDLVPKRELSPVTNSNGLAWNLQDDTLYYIDTPTRKVAAFDYEPINGTLSNKRIVFDLQKSNVSGLPDGMTIDRNGNIWVALYNGGGVANVDPSTGKVIRIIKLPVQKVTSCAFGGPLLDTLFVTTSSRGMTPEQLNEEPHAGYVFAVKGLGVQGLVANSFKM